MGVTSVRQRRAVDVRSALPIAVPAAAAFGMTIVNVWRPSMYGTEAVTVYAAHLPLPSLFHLLSHVDAVHGAYYLLMHFVLAAGGGTVMLRLPSVLAMTFAAGATARLSRRLTGSDTAALFAGLVLALSPLTTEYGQAGRSYAIDTAAAVVTWSLFVTALDQPSRRAWWNYTFALALTAYLHEMTLLVIAANLATLAWSRQGREVWRGWIRATGWALFLDIPLIVTSVIQSRQVSWIKPATWSDVRALYQNFFGPGLTALWINAALALVCVLVAVRREVPQRTVGAVRLALPIVVVSPLLLLVESMVGPPLYGGTRYVVWVLPAVAILVGIGLDHVLRLVAGPKVRAAAGVAVLVAGVASQWSVQQRVHSTAGAPQDMLAAATYLRDHEQAGDGVIFAPRSFYALRLGYRADLAPLHDLVLGQSGRYGGRLYGTEMSGGEITEAVAGANRIWLVGLSSPGTSRRPELAALAKYFHAVTRHHVIGVTITLYEKNGT